MNILIITKYAWNDTLASGNTLSNLFSNWDDTIISTIYCRDAKPNNNCCSNYFVVSPINVIKYFFTPWRIGYSFTTDKLNTIDETDILEKTITSFSKKHKFIMFFYDFLYSTKVWLNKKIKNYIVDTNPDIVFTFGTPDAFSYYLIKYIKKNYNLPVVTYFVDNHFKNNINIGNIYYLIYNNRLKNLAQLSDKCYVISELMREEYSNKMCQEFKLLHKGCEKNIIVQKNNNPIRATYAGNLLYGRDKVLELISSALKSLNNEINKDVHLDIYTTSYPDTEFKNKMVLDNVTTIHGQEPYSNIKKILRDSNIVIHVESFERDQIELVRFSFSTKITDCLQSGAMVLAIGPSCLASISYLQKIPGVVVITNPEEIFNVMRDLLTDSSLMENNAIATSKYVNESLNIERTREMLKNDFLDLKPYKQ